MRHASTFAGSPDRKFRIRNSSTDRCGVHKRRVAVQPAGQKVRIAAAIKAAAVAAGTDKEDKMRVLTQTELSRCTRGELSALLNSIVQTLPVLPEGSCELQTAHKNLQNIRRSLGKPTLG